MPARATTLLRYIRGIAAPPRGGETSDAALVRRFLAGGDDRAFSELVKRHGALVLQACRRVLGDDDAEDAFQATFLVLARKAHSVQSYASLTRWLYAVARRVALKARVLRARRYRLERAVPHKPMTHPDPLHELSCREVLAILDEEAEHLPEKQRLPVLLCCFEGLSLEEAAARLGWKPGAVKGHLQRGRHRLHKRLVRRGLTLTAALMAVEASRGPASSAVIARLAGAIGSGAHGLANGRPVPAAGFSTGVTELARSALGAPIWKNLVVAGGCLLPVLLVTLGFALHARENPPSSDRPDPDSVQSPPGPALAADQPARVVDEDDVPIKVNGRVLDPTGKPLAGANLYVGYALSMGSVENVLPSPEGTLPLRAKSGADGRFEFTFSRSELDARELDDGQPAVIAVANGYGPEWSLVAGPGEAEALTLKLVEDLPVNGRIADSKGEPVAGVKIRVLNVDTVPANEMTRFVNAAFHDDRHRRRWRGAFPEQPPEVTSDADGRFRLTGLGRDRIAMLVQDEPVHPSGFFYAVASPDVAAHSALFHGATFDVVAAAVRRVRGVCRDRDTGTPLPGVGISVVHASARARRTDGDGRFEISVPPSQSCILAEPESGQPYFTASALVPNSPGSEPITLNFDLIRGVPVTGKVQAPPGAKLPRAGRVEYLPLWPNPRAADIQTWHYVPASSGFVRPDGSFRLVVLPGPGAVAVDASPKRTLAAAAVDDRELARFFGDAKNHQDEQGLFTVVGSRVGRLPPGRYKAVSLINPDATAESLALNVQLAAGVRLRGRLLDPDGQPLGFVKASGLTPRRGSETLDSPSFEITELRPNEVREVAFLHPEKKLGKVLTVPAGQAEPFDVRLERCGTITGRLVDKEGRPVPNGIALFRRGGVGYDDSVIPADEKGRFEKPLVPGMKYSFSHGLRRRATASPLGEIQLEPGQSRDLGDVFQDDNRRPPIN